MKPKPSLLLAGLGALLVPATALRIATSLQWIEHTPQPYAIKNFYKGSSAATLISGGVANLADKTVDLAANAETQGLKQYATQKNYRLIYVICEAGYRLVANKASGVSKLADLKGKRVGTLPGSSAGYFVSKLLSTAGLKDGDYKTATGNVCMRAPCGAGTFPQMITNNQLDAFGIWEPAVELGAQALGSNAIIFQNVSVYREVYSLYTTTDKLNNATIRKDILAYVAALNQTLDVFRNTPQKVYAAVAQDVGMDPKVVEAVWPVHRWTGRWGADLLDFLVEEDAWLSRTDRRTAVSRADIAKFLDPDVMDELKI